MTAPQASPLPAPSVWRQTWLVFVALGALYLLTAGGGGYSVDGMFSYQMARHIALRPSEPLSHDERDVLKRWGPVSPVLGAPLAKLGALLAQAAPWRDSIPLDGRDVRLFDWQPIGPGDGTTPDAMRTLTIPLPAHQVRRLRVVSFLSYAATLPDQTPVATVAVGGAGASGLPVALRAGVDTAEWAYDVVGADRSQHHRAPLAGHWPGNPDANLYVTSIDLPAADLSQVTVQYLAPAGRLHIRALLAETADGAVPATGPAAWTDEQQEGLFSRLAFSFMNAPLMALAGALLVPVAARLGYATGDGAVLGLGVGAATLAWPYAKLDFSEAAAAGLAMGSLGLIVAALPAGQRPRVVRLLLASVVAAAAASAKYTAAVFVPLLALEVIALCGGGVRTKLRAVAAFAALPTAALAVALAGRGGPNVLDWRGALTRGWLDFDPWQGLYGLLLSPGKSLFLYAPPLLLSLVGAAWFIKRHRGAAIVFVLAPLAYLAMFSGKGVWSGGGWGPRYLLPAVPFAACLALPVVERATARRGGWRVAGVAVLVAGGIVQLLGVAKHPNLYTIMFRDHVLPHLPDYGAPYGGPPALAYWRHFGGPDAGRQLDRPADDGRPEDLPRGLGYAYAEDGPLVVRLAPAAAERPLALTLYLCDWDHRGRRQRITVTDADGVRAHDQNYGFSGCEYLTWPVAQSPGAPVEIRVDAQGADTPVLSALFFDPPGSAGQGVARDTVTAGHWTERFGRDGFVLLGWRRGGQDVARLPAYVSGISGGQRVWIDTGEADLEDTALLYAPAFSPLLAHAWLLAGDAVRDTAPRNTALLSRVLGSTPWRYLAQLEIHPDHPEYGLGLDFWPLLLRAQLRSHSGFMALVWAVEALFGLVAALGWWQALRGIRVVRVA